MGRRTLLQMGMEGEDVRDVQRDLLALRFEVHMEGKFDKETSDAVRAFQAQNMDQHGTPLVVDGRVGDLTWWSLTHPKPSIQTVAAIDFKVMPPVAFGGGTLARAALGAAIGELMVGAGEVGGNNKGPFVRKYHATCGIAEGEPWCTTFVSWCYLQAAGRDRGKLPFNPSGGSRDVLNQLRRKKLAASPGQPYDPLPGDLVFWWRESLNGPKGHVGMVHQLKDGMLYTIEGNRSSTVQGFSYVASRMDKLLGFGQLSALNG